MVKFKLCNLHDMSPEELLEHYEEAEVSHTLVIFNTFNYLNNFLMFFRNDQSWFERN